MKTKDVLLRQLRIDPCIHRTISITGAGGKTSLMKRLRDELVSQGFRVIITTSTHILYDDPERFVRCGDAGGDPLSEAGERIRGAISRYGYAVAGSISDDACPGVSKISSPGDEVLNKLRDLCDVLLVEADGARGQQIKIPAAWEPVIIPQSDLIIAVAGAGAVGNTIADAAYRPEDFAHFTGKNTGDVIEWSDIVQIASSEDGLRKGAGSKEYRFYLNAVDAMTDPADALRITDCLASAGISAECGSIRNADCMGAVILAAGLGTRFGGDKLKSPVEGKPMYMRILDEMSEIFSYKGVTFVTSDGDLAYEAAETGARVVINRHPQDGISSSMKLGLIANLHMGSCLFAVADQPYISSESIASLVEGFRDSGRQLASMVSKDGDFSNPCIFGAPYYGELSGISGDRGGKAVIRRHAEDVCTCMPLSESELYDVDTKEDLERVRGL